MTNPMPPMTAPAASQAKLASSKEANGPVESELTGDKLKKMTAWIKDQYSKMKSDRQSAQRQWYINLSMYYGQQYLEIMGPTGNSKLATPRAPSYRSRTTTNRIRPLIRTEIVRMTSQKPTASVVPATGSDDDMFAAEGGEAIWEYLQDRRNFQPTMANMAFWTSIAGTCFIKTWWDREFVDPFTLSADTKQPLKGDVRFGVTTPFNLFVPDLLEIDLEDQPYVFEVYTRSVAWVKKFHGVDVTADVVSRNEIVESSYFQVPGGNGAKPDSVLVIEAWIKPGGCELMPDGGVITLVGNQVARQGKFYSHMQYPYAKFEHIPTGKFYGDSVLVDINPLQKELNRTRSQIIESKNLMGRPQLLVAEGSMNTSKYTSQPGLLVTYRPGLPPPTPLPMQPLPAYVLQEVDRIVSDMEDISGQHQVSKGMAPGGGVTAATAISFLQEKDDSLMGTTYDSIERGVEKIARQTLQLVVDYYTLPRIIQTTGIDQAFDSLELKGADIINGRNIRIEAGSALPQSKPARQAFLMDMAKFGFITGDQLLDLLDVGGVHKLTERIRIDMRQAQRENMKMKKITQPEFQEFMVQTYQNAMQGGEDTIDPNTGMPLIDPNVPATYPPMIPVNEWDNHAIHIATHNNYRKTQEYETLDAEVRDQFARHIALHEQALQEAQMQQMQTGMMPPGGDGSAPPPEQDGQGGPQGAPEQPQGGAPQ